MKTATKQPPTIPATSSTVELLFELHARQDESMRFILSAAEPSKQNKFFNELAALLAWTQTISNIHWRAIGVPNGPVLFIEPSPVAAASTAFKAHAQQAPAQPVQPLKLPESTADIDWRDSDEPACRPAIRMEIDISDGNSVTHIQQSVYRETDTDPLMQLPPNLHIGWHGTQTVIDEAGREWTRTFGPCVIDNFGSLADCFTGEPA